MTEPKRQEQPTPAREREEKRIDWSERPERHDLIIPSVEEDYLEPPEPWPGPREIEKD